MLKKFILTILIIFVTNSAPLFAQNTSDYIPHLQKGALIKVYTRTPLSTDNLDEGSIVNFIAGSDLWVLEKKAIEKGDIFFGYVDMLKMPIKGVNAAMSIKVKKIVKKNGFEDEIDGNIIFPNGSDVLGGNLSNPASYNTSFHPRKVYGNIWGGSLQYVPSGEYEHGVHVGINSRDSLFIQLNEEYYF